MRKITVLLLLLFSQALLFAQTSLIPGDLMVVGINTNNAGGAQNDDIVFFCFKDIAAGTYFDITDNGYEKVTANRWGDQEGFFRIARKAGAATIVAGSPINIQTSSTFANYKIFVCGADDTNNWTLTNLGGTFNLAPDDNLWIMTRGTWANPTGAENATYSNGVALFGYVSGTWRTSAGYNDNTSSTIFQYIDCLALNFNTSTNDKRYKFAGPFTTANAATWISRILNNANWANYNNNNQYNSARNYVSGACADIRFDINGSNQDNIQYGTWTGQSNTDWFNCANWSGRRVPDTTIAVVIPTSATRKPVISKLSTLSSRYNGEAGCASITLHANSFPLELEYSNLGAAVLTVKGDLVLETATGIHSPGGRIDMNDGASGTPDGVIHLQGNWVNKVGTNSFDEGEGTVVFRGAANTIISTADATSLETFHNLQNIKSGVLTLNSDVAVANELVMKGHHIVTNNQVLHIGVSTANKGILSYVSGFVKGNMRRWYSGINLSDATSLFPLGTSDNKIRFVRVAYTTSATVGGYITGSFVESDPGDSGLPILSDNTNGFPSDVYYTSPEGYWRMDNQTGSLNDGQYTITCTAQDLGGLASLDDLTLLKRVNGGQWHCPGTHQSASGTIDMVTVARTEVSGWSNFNIGRGLVSTPLPVELLTFNGEKTADGIHLQWATALEINSDRFEVEHSTDGVNFQVIDIVKAAMYATTTQYYSATHLSFTEGHNYYRLRMVDLDETYEYSPMIVVNSETTKIEVAVFPNPVVNNMMLRLSKPAVFTVIDLTGRTVLNGATTENNQVLNLDATALPTGLYTIQTIADTHRESIKFFKQ